MNRLPFTTVTVIALTAGCLSLSACASGPPKAEPIVQIKEVAVAVAKSCVPADLKPQPIYPDTDEVLKAAAGGAERYQIIAAGRLLRIQRGKEVEPVVAACR